MNKVHYKSCFISDIHMGSQESRIDYLLSFLKQSSFDNLFLVGDTIDFIHLYEVHGVKIVIHLLRKFLKVSIKELK